jgi:hypothetical protein
MVVFIGAFGVTMYVSKDGGPDLRYYEYISNSAQVIISTDVSGGVNIVEPRQAALLFWNQTIEFVKTVRTIHHPDEEAKSLTFKFELVKNFTANTIVFKYEIDDDVSYETTFNKAAQTITTKPRDSYTVNWVDFVGYFDAYNDFIREVRTF